MVFENLATEAGGSGKMLVHKGAGVGKHRMIDWAIDLWPLNRSLTGPGVRETLSYLRVLNPELREHSAKSGEEVFDWTVPQEWHVRDAFLEHVETGERFAEFSKSNLHLVGYSEPVNTVMQLEDLKSRIFTQLDQPDWVPYVTSYYKRTWGFCLSQNDFDALPDGAYRVVVDSELFDGEMLYSDAVLQGETDEEVFFSTYVCHPSMANNEISGPVLASALMRYIKQVYPKPRCTYRFAFVPETIGSLTYISRNFDQLREKVIAGFVLSCVGDDRAYSHVESRLGTSLADDALRAALAGKENVKTYSFLQRGSDERQYCAPGIDLPVAGFCRSKYGEYPEYHTSADNFDVVSQEGLEGALSVMRSVIDAFEVGLFPRAQVFGEPQLSKRGLYPTVSQKGSHSDVRTRTDLLAYADGEHNLFEIASKVGVGLRALVKETRLLRDAELLR